MFPVLAIAEDTVFIFLPHGYPFSWALNTHLFFGCFIMTLLPLSIISILFNSTNRACSTFMRKGYIGYKGLDSTLNSQQRNDPSVV